MRYEKRTISTTHPKHGEIKFEAEVGQAESLIEFTGWAGGEEKHLEVSNSAAATGAVNGARAYARNAADTDTVEEIVAKARAVARGYTPTGAERGPSKKEKLATFDALMAQIRSGQLPSDEELDALASKFSA